MSTITEALEAEVAAIRAIGGRSSARARSEIDRHFTRLMRLIAPRIRHFTRAYGLADHAEDAAQACAIGLHRALAAYDPARARFTTFVNWQLRGELQALRFRLHTDSRGWARTVGAATVSLDAMHEGGADLPITDEGALERTEALAAETLARRACGTLLDEHYAQTRRMAIRQTERRHAPRGQAWLKPGTCDPAEIERIDQRLRIERDVVTAHLLGEEEWADVIHSEGGVMTPEQRRQIARRTLRALTDRARGNPRYDPDALALDLPRGGRRFN